MRKKDYSICPKESDVCFNCICYSPDTDDKLKDADFSNDGECNRYPVPVPKAHTSWCGEFKREI